MKKDQTVEAIVERVAALDIGKAEVVCCVRVPTPGGQGRDQEVRTFQTMTQDLVGLRDWLGELQVGLVVMEATSDYWKPVFHVLEETIPQTWLVNARDVKHLPGRPKTDVLDAQWLCRLAERGMLRPSFVPPPLIRQLRDLTRYRVDLTVGLTAEKQRVEKLLEDAGIKLSVVASDLFGVSGRRMLQALIAGEQDPHVLADMALKRLRNKKVRLEQSLTGRFTEHHRFLLAQMMRRIQQTEADIVAIDAQIDSHVESFKDVVLRLTAIPGLGHTNAVAIIAEIGLDMDQFPTDAHLASWAKFAPTTKQSAGRTIGREDTGHGNPYLARSLGQAAMSISNSKTFLGQRFQRLQHRRNTSVAVVAVGRSILTIIWHLIADPTQTYKDLGPDWHTRHHDEQRTIRNLTRTINQFGYQVTLTPIPA